MLPSRLIHQAGLAVLAFFVLAVVIACYATVGQPLLGLGWFVCLTANSVHLRRTR